MAKAGQKVSIAKHKDGKKRKVAVRKSSGSTIRHVSKDGYVTITKTDYKGRKTVKRYKKGGEENS